MNAKIPFILLVAVFCAAGCAPKKSISLFREPEEPEAPVLVADEIDLAPEMVPLTEEPPIFFIPMPDAPGFAVEKNSKAEMDYSNAKDGYIMVRCLEKTDKELRVLVNGPSGDAYTYTLKSDGAYEVFPLSDGSGDYKVGVYENISDNRYSTFFSAGIQAKLCDEFAPFLRPNQYVNYSRDSKVVKKAEELTKDADGLFDKISIVYEYVTNNITYDKQLAASVQSGYLPDVDAVLENGRGICFDYAAVATAMLRSQMIPTKLVVGYTGDAYHAWINVYSEETGWLDSVIYFDGMTWNLMDPTFAAGKVQEAKIMKYIGNAKNYTAKYLY